MKRFGEHAKTAPPHMLTDVRFELVRLNERTPDGRLIQDPGFGVRDLPQSFSAMHTTGHGHGEALIDGSLDEVTVEDDGRVWGMGWLLNTPHARLTGKMIQAGALTGNSIELSVKAVKVDFDMDAMKMLVDFTEADLSATTCVGTPAMAGCTVELVDPEFDFSAELTDEAAAAFANEVESFVAGNVTVGALPAFASNFSVIEADTAEAPPIAVPESAPPALWFVDPMLAEPTPVRVEPANEQGLYRVYGHVADWTHPHLSVPGIELFAPRSRTNYAYFANREVLCSDGTFAATGVLTHGGPHAAAELDWRAATAHYDNTCHAWADVSVGEDEHGIWIAGYVRPGTDENTVIAARASGLSGDWRRIRGNLEMVGALSVNAAAFPQRRPSGFAEAGIQTSLVSAGLVGLPVMHGNLIPIPSTLSEDLGYVASRLRAEELADIAEALTVDDLAELDAILAALASDPADRRVSADRSTSKELAAIAETLGQALGLVASASFGDSDSIDPQNARNYVAAMSALSYYVAKVRSQVACDETPSPDADPSACARDGMSNERVMTGGIPDTGAAASAFLRAGRQSDFMQRFASLGADEDGEINGQEFAEWVEQYGDDWDELMQDEAFATESLGDRVMVIGYDREGNMVRPHFRRRPKRGQTSTAGY